MILTAYAAAGVVYLAAIVHAVLYHRAGKPRARHRPDKEKIT